MTQSLAQRFTVEQLVHYIGSAVFKVGIVNCQDVGVIESACCTSLLLETLQAFRVSGDAGRQNLDRHVASDAGIPLAIYLAHASGPEKTDNLVRPKYSSDHGSRSAFRQGFGSYLQGGRFQKVLGLRVTFEQRLHFGAKLLIGAGFLKITAARARFEFASGVIEFLDLTPSVQF